MYKIRSDVTGKIYNVKDTIRVGNPRLQALFIKHKAEILDVYQTEDIYTGEPIVCMLFDKKKTDHLHELWKKHELR